jgi:hypothetical protein
MRACGIELKGTDAVVVLIEGTKENFTVHDVKPARFSIPDDENQDEVKAFRDAIHSFLRTNGVELIAVKKRAKKGDFSGGPVSFKLEGIIQLYDGCGVKLIAAPTIKAALRKKPVTPPDFLNKYQHEAFCAAFTALP